MSASIAKIAPAATAVTAAITSGENAPNTLQPSHAATPESRAIPPRTPKT